MHGKIISFDMSEKQNQSPETTGSSGARDPRAVSATGISPEKTATEPSPVEAPTVPIWKKAWGYFIWFLDFLHKETPAPPSDVPKKGLRKCWAGFNAFLDALDGLENEPEAPRKPLKERIRDFNERFHSPEDRKNMLSAFWDFCWTAFFRCTVAVFLFVVTMLGVIRVMDYFEAHHVKFYPTDKQVVSYLVREHESLEAVACEMTTMAGKDENIPVERFGNEFVETIKPVGAYSDAYGVYIITSKDWYSGEHGIFIARDNNNMPPMLSWGLIEGRIYAYTYFDD